MHEQAYCCDEAANHQLPIAVEERSHSTQKLMQIHCSTSSVILNAMATQCMCSLNSVYHPQ